MSIPVNQDTLMHWRGCIVKVGGTYMVPFDSESSEYYSDEDGEYLEDTIIYLRDKDGKEHSLYESDGDTFKPVYPRMGYRNKDKTAFFISRPSVRTYRKGIGLDTVSIFFPQEEELAVLSLLPRVEVWDLLNQEYPSLEEAKRLILSKEAWAVAFHRFYAFVLKAGHDRPVLYYKFHQQGFLNSDGTIEFLRGEEKFNLEVGHVNMGT